MKRALPKLLRNSGTFATETACRPTKEGTQTSVEILVDCRALMKTLEDDKRISDINFASVKPRNWNTTVAVAVESGTIFTSSTNTIAAAAIRG